jgi:hypothetical protein
MDLKDILPGLKNNRKEYYWALVLEPGWVQAGIWFIGESKAEVISNSSATAWDNDNDLVSAADTALSSAIQNLPEEIGEPTKTVFGVPSSWVGNGTIKDEYLEKIKKICSSLSLEPSGFVVLSEAIAHLIKSEEGSPLTAVVIGVNEDNLEVSVFKSGNLIGSSSISRSVSVSEDVIEGLSRFNLPEEFPSRFLIFDGKGGELEDIKQSLISANWDSQEKIKFLHTPKVEIVETDRKVTATALAGASEISQVTKIESVQEVAEEIPIGEEIENIKAPESAVKPEDLGFVVGEDIAKEEQSHIPMPEPEKVAPLVLAQTKTETMEVKKGLGGFKTFAFWGEVKKKISSIKLPGGPSKNLLVTLGIIAGVIILSLFLVWWFLPKATVTIFVSPKKLEDAVKVGVNTSLSASDIGNKVFSGTVISTSTSGEKTKDTTGTKTIGDKAKGTVKLQNGTSSIINLAAGTILLAGNDLKFTINSAASVSAALSPSSPGEKSVDVTAYDIGAQYNLAKDEIFKVGNYPKSDVDAIATINFSGGTSRQISAVSSEDQKSLQTDLENELLTQAKTNLQNKIPEGSYLIDDSLMATSSAKTFSDRVGDEATNIKLNLTLNISAITIRSDDLYSVVKEVLGSKIPTGYTFRNEQVVTKFTLENSKSDLSTFNFLMTANLLPQINIDSIKEKIKGKSVGFAENYLGSIPGFSRAEINPNIKLPGGLNSLPRLSKNITIEVATER